MHIVFITGAGVSAASGLPTYRGPGGLYGDEPVEDGYRIDEILSRQVATLRPDLFEKYYGQIRDAIDAVEPNAMHLAIAALQKTNHVQVFTQNVDDLHERAGTTDVIHLHGGGAAGAPVVLFGDMLDLGHLKMLKHACGRADVLCVVGTSAGFPYILRPVKKAQYQMTKVIILDPDRAHPLRNCGTQYGNPETYADIIARLPEMK